MGWIYHTSITPNDQENSFNEAYEIFLKQCTINKQILDNELLSGQSFRFVIKTDDKNDHIVCNKRIFLKSKFLMSKSFKKSLIDYYKPLNIFVKGPKEILRRDGSSINKWLIELFKVYPNYVKY